MEMAVTREEAEARWLLDRRTAEAGSQQAWPGDVTGRMSEFEWLTLASEILMPVWNELTPDFGEARQENRRDRQPTEDGHDDDGGMEEINVNQVYSVILSTAAACNRWLKKDLGPRLRNGGQDFETSMTLDPAADIDRWARERAGPMMDGPAGEDGIGDLLSSLWHRQGAAGRPAQARCPRRGCPPLSLPSPMEKSGAWQPAFWPSLAGHGDYRAGPVGTSFPSFPSGNSVPGTGRAIPGTSLPPTGYAWLPDTP